MDSEVVEIQDSKLDETPKDWSKKTIDDVAIINRENVNPSKEFPEEEFTYIDISNVESGGTGQIINPGKIIGKEAPSRARRVVKKNDVILSTVRPYLKSYTIVPEEYDGEICSTGYAVLTAKEDTDPHFLLYSCLTSDVQQQFKRMMRGANYPALNLGHVKQTTISFPPPSEQKKIATILSTVQDAIEQTEAVIQATRELKKSMMKHLFTYGSVPVDQTDQVELEETDIGPIPSSWELVKVKEVFDFSRKPRSLDIEKDDEIPFIPMENISEVWNEIDLYQEKKWNEINSGSYVEKGDLIVAKITPSFENGKQAMLNDLPNEFGYATTEIWALHPNEEKRVLPELLFYYLKKPAIRNSIANKMEGSTGRQRVPKSVLRNLLIPLPNLETQKKIVDNFVILDSKIKQESDKIESLKSLFNSLLENLMTAKVRVV